jgi:hypothetical protein
MPRIRKRLICFISLTVHLYDFIDCALPLSYVLIRILKSPPTWSCGGRNGDRALGVWWYEPSQSDIAARRAEREELQASIEDSNKRSAKMKAIGCGPKSRLCVRVDRAAGAFGVPGRADCIWASASAV